jgi:hypothetical protein
MPLLGHLRASSTSGVGPVPQDDAERGGMELCLSIEPSCKVLSSAPTMATLAIAWATLLGRFVGAGPIAACQPEVQRVGNNHDCAR